MSLVKANSLQLGQSVTATNNFTWYQPASPDGTVRLGNGNSGSVTDLVTLTSAGNLGIGTSGPGYKLDIVAASNTSLASTIRVNSNNLAVNTNIAYDGVTGSGQLTVQAGSASALIFGAGGAEKMRLDSSGNLLVGTTSTPSSFGISIGVKGTVGQALGGMQNTNWRIREKNQTDWCAWTTNINDAGTQDDVTKSSWLTQQGYGNGLDAWRVGRYPAGSSTLAEFMRLDASGNLGLGVTPFAAVAGWTTLNVGNSAFGVKAATGSVNLGANATLNNIYITSNAASLYGQDLGVHRWYTAPSGTAGNAISWTQAMTLDASGNLILNVGEYIRITGTTISVGTSATAITGAHSFGSTAIVRGINGGQIFGDLVFFSDSVVTVLASHGVSGGPAARTYTAVGGVLKLAMASGTYSVNVGITTVV